MLCVVWCGVVGVCGCGCGESECGCVGYMHTWAQFEHK